MANKRIDQLDELLAGAAADWLVISDTDVNKARKISPENLATLLSTWIGGGATSLPDLTDVSTAAVTNRFALIANGTTYEGRVLVKADISDLGTILTNPMPDSTPLNFGTGSDMSIQHNGVDSIIQNDTGDLIIYNSNNAAEIRLWCGSTNGNTSIRLANSVDNPILIAYGSRAIEFSHYGVGNHTGTPAYMLGVDDAGGVIEVAAGVEINAQTGTTYTLVLGDARKMVTLSNAAPITMTVPPNSSVAFPVGTEIALSQIGAGQVTVAAGSGVTINSYNSDLKLAGQYAAASLLKTATNTWLLVGNLTT